MLDNRLKSESSSQSFFQNIDIFWLESIRQDYKLSQDVLSKITAGYEALYHNLYKFKNTLTGILLPMHTKLFLESNMQNPMLIALLQNDLRWFIECRASQLLDRDTLKEFQLLAALCGATDVTHYLTDKEELKIDLDVLNMALWSGQYTGPSLEYFTRLCAPTHDSLKYAIASINENVVREMLDIYHLKPSSDYLTVAAGTGNAAIFNLLISHGVVPKGDLVFKIASLSENQEIMHILERDFAYVGSGLGASKNSQPKS